MKKHSIWKTLAVLLAAAVLLSACGPTGSDTIKIGVNAPLTGDIPKVGEGSKFAAEMWLEEIDGTLEIGGETYQVELVIEDNESKAESAASVNQKLITQDDVIAIVGPQSSKQAVPAGGVANDLKTPMVSPWSTNPNTTLDRPWVFRTPFLDSFQGPAVAKFVSEEFGYTKAGVLYDVASDYPKGLAEFFQKGWEDLHGEGSVVAFESFTTGDTDFSAQLTKIIDSGAEFIFTPQYYNEVALIVQQARELGFDAPIVGSDSWGSAELLTLCGEDCYGLFYSSHYLAENPTGEAKEFIDGYEERYGYVPDDVGALTWDTMHIIERALKECGEITGNIEEDRACVKDALAQIENFDGVTGRMTFTEQGDPIKCALIIKIDEEGGKSVYEQTCP
jgi:branched-chain amino acid transport system substrate-binding protein